MRSVCQFGLVVDTCGQNSARCTASPNCVVPLVYGACWKFGDPSTFATLPPASREAPSAKTKSKGMIATSTIV